MIAAAWTVALGAFAKIFACVLVVTAGPQAPSASSASAAQSLATLEDFTIVQISDTHVLPRLAGEPVPKTLQGEETFRWMHDALATTQTAGGVEVAAPSFVVVTGDITEFGAPGETWTDVERLFAHLPCPWYFVPGNHDNTWHPIVGPMKKQNPAHTWYASFDRFGCHFVFLNSATLQEPLPSFDAAQLEWLKKDVELVGDRPVFVFLHHPPDSTEFAQPYTRRMLFDALDSANVAAIFYGHGHAVKHHVVDGYDCIQGGSTFAARGADNRGYNVIAVKDARLRVAYRWIDAKKSPMELLDKRLAPRDSNANPIIDLRVSNQSTLLSGRIDAYVERSPTVDGTLAREHTAVFLDDTRVEVEWFGPTSILSRAPFRPVFAGVVSAFRIDTRAVPRGMHLLTVETSVPEFRPCQRSMTVVSEVRRTNPAGHRNEENDPGEYRDGSKFGTRSIESSLEESSTFPRISQRVDLRGRVDLYLPLHAPKDFFHGVVAWSADPKANRSRHEFLSSGGAYVDPVSEGVVFLRQRHSPDRPKVDILPLRTPSFATALVADDRAYFGDVDGRLYAIDVDRKEELWCVPTGGFAIEAAPAIAGDLVVVGTWDGNVYALHVADGTLAWKQPGPRSSAGGGAARYYAPADVSPVLAGESIFVCDRGYELARYSFAGEMTKLPYTNVAAIGGSEDGRCVNLRCHDNRLVRIDAQGKELWTTKVELGRLPVAPTELDGRIHVASDTGLVTTLDAATGRVLDTYRATPGAYVMAPVQVDSAGNLHVAGTDGFETSFTLPK